MKKRFLFFIGIVLLGVSILCCNNSGRKEPKTSAAIEKEKVLRIAEEIAFREYGNVIKNELPLKAKLVGDSVWVIEGTLAKNADGGTVYIELSRSDNRLLKITHYK